MNILTHDGIKKNPLYPELGKLVELFNGVIPFPLLISNRDSDAPIEADSAGVLCSNVASDDLDQTHFAWTDIGQIIRMLQELTTGGQNSTLVKCFIQLFF